MEDIFKTTSVEERNKFIEECYWKNIKYEYSDKNNEGYYIVKIKD